MPTQPFNADLTPHHTLDTQGLICPEPIMLLHRTMRKANGGEIIHVIASDPATLRDIPNFCQHLGHTLLEKQEILNPNNLENPDHPLDPYANVYHFWLKKREN